MDLRVRSFTKLMTTVGTMGQSVDRTPGNRRMGDAAHMSTTQAVAAETVTYDAPNGMSDFHRIADQLAADHPRNMMAGTWKMESTGTEFRFTWIKA